MEKMITFVTMLAVLSGAAERLVEIVKSCSPSLSQPRSDPVQEAHRQGFLHLIAVVCCLVTSTLVSDQLGTALGWEGSKWTLTLCFGVLAAGGSSLWNSVLTYLLSVKDIKRAEATEKKATSLASTPMSQQLSPNPPGIGWTTS